jgi:hypothetical protein
LDKNAASSEEFDKDRKLNKKEDFDQF